MEDRDKETQQSQSKSRILSPDQVEEIDTTFNNVFNKAKNDGIIRDSRTYRSFDEIFEISMRLHKGEKVTDEELYRPVAGLQLLRVQSPRVEALSKVDTSRFETRCSMDVTPNVERHSGEPHRVETPNVGKQNAEASSAVHSSVEKPSVERRSVEVRQLEEMQIEQPTITETEVVETTTSRKVRIEASPKEDITMNELAFSDEETSQSKPRRMEITPPVTEERPKKGVKRKRSEQTPTPGVLPGRQRPFWGNKFTGPLYPEFTHKWRREQRRKALEAQLNSNPDDPSHLKPPVSPLSSSHSTHDRSMSAGSLSQYYLELPPMTTITLVCQRKARPKPRGLHIPFYGRRKSRTKRIPLDHLWDLYFRHRRESNNNIPKKVSPATIVKPQDGIKILGNSVAEEGPERGRPRVRTGADVVDLGAEINSTDSLGVKTMTSGVNGDGGGEGGAVGHVSGGAVAKNRRSKPGPRRASGIVGGVNQRSPEL